MVDLIDHINEEIVRGRYYQALKLAQKLIGYEQEVIRRVQQPIESLRNG